MMSNEAKGGFVYDLEWYSPTGELIAKERAHNLFPTEGINHMLSVAFGAGIQNATWYVGLYKAVYNPQPGDTMATFPATAQEATEYSGANRLAIPFNAAAGGAISTDALAIEFVFTTGATIQGGFVASSPTKGATTGVLASAVRFPSPKIVEAGSSLKVTVGHEITSL